MTSYSNENRWTLNKNDKKREGKQDADYTGSVNINGVEYWINGWVKDGRSGKFISGSIKPKEAQRDDPISSGGGRIPF